MSERLYTAEIDSPIGPMTLTATDKGICHLDFAPYDLALEKLEQWTKRVFGHAGADITRVEAASHDQLNEAARQLALYFAGELQQFDLPIQMYGTPFQQKVWAALQQIPYGETRTYKDIAVMLDQPGAMRAVGGANNRNPVSIIVPCHRVIGASGQMIGYGGGLPIKIALLDLEKSAK
ncbi:[Fe-S]-binding protein [Paenibacillus sp. FSL A5-0031]|uniref:methylated-DNA--[protein]-cysteine S-methyltransferase n=1 Tax=Paenibacillus sp. FSL A5-0031 TaxID=1920420 RepID=UPI00096C2BA1|nr:methylated-DNA--[protein]-cysteine S-methyltransferase [Paenibacillus sp. FSL A5-0031]OME81527.1 [Fe-S]-binding protein [Paenibacillus sp. FSL A5-0031]